MMDINGYYWEDDQEQSSSPPQSNVVPKQYHKGMDKFDNHPQQGEDPVSPEYDPHEQHLNYHKWQKDFLDLAKHADANDMMDHLKKVKDNRDLNAIQRKFVDDNYRLAAFRQMANIHKASNDLRRKIKQELDHGAPAYSLMNIITEYIETSGDHLLKEMLMKVAGYHGMKGEIHRKFIASILGAVQVGGGGDKGDLDYIDNEQTLDISTRYYSEFGGMTIGRWQLTQNDPEHYLSESELHRMKYGSPEERQVLQKRVIIETIASQFKDRAFLIHVLDVSSGTMYAMGWDVADSIKSAYNHGAIVIHFKDNDDKESAIDINNEFVEVLSVHIDYLKMVDDLDESGNQRKEKVPFMRVDKGVLRLVAGLDTIQDAFSGGISGCFFKEMPYNGNPAEILQIIHAIPSIDEMLMRRI